MRRWKRFLGIMLFAITLAQLSPAAWSRVEPALWKSQELRFIYRSHQTVYDCDQLRRKLQEILVLAGVHANTRIEPQTCTVSRLPDMMVQFASLRIDLIHAVPAEPQNVAAASKTRAREDLLERLGAGRIPMEHFSAQRSLVDIGGDRHLALTSADCELLQQITHQVLKELSLDVVAHQAHCSATPHRLAAPLLKVSVLKPAVAGNLDGDVPLR